MRSFSLLVFLALLAPIKAEEIASRVFPDGTEVVIHAPISVLPSGGFFPVRVEIRSQAPGSLTWNVRCRSNIDTYGSYGFRGRRRSSAEGMIRSEFSVTCPAGEERKIDLLIPVHNLGGDRSIDIQCSTGDGSRSLGGHFGESSGKYAIGISQDFAQRFKSKVSAAYSRLGTSSTRRSYRSSSPSGMNGLIDVARMPEDWRAYSGYDVIVLTRVEWVTLGPGVKLALDQWIRSGGNFILLNEESGEVPGFENSSSSDGLGLRNRMDCGPDYKKFEGEAFKKIIIGGGGSRGELILGDYDRGDWDVGNALGRRTRSKAFLLFALIVFAIVVGPVNLFFWANNNRRHRLFVTTPIISIVASLLLVGFIVIRDGFGGDGARAIAIEVGGPDDKSAIILQEQFSRSGILFSAGFELDGDSVLSPLVPPVTDLNRQDSVNSTGSFNLAFEQTKEGWDLNGNLFQSRSEQAQLLRAVVPSRERLELLPGNSDSPRLVSSFSYPLTDVFYQDGEGEIWKAPGISPGETVTLSASSSVSDRNSGVSEAISRFGASHRKKLGKLLVRPNSFVALATEAPSIATHSSIDWMESPTLITGLLSQ